MLCVEWGLSQTANRTVANTFYLRIACNHLHLTHLESSRVAVVEADPPFSNQRLLVAEFSIADRLIAKTVQSLMPKRLAFLNAAPKLLIQPLERLEGGLSQVEERILMELGMGAGARKVVVHVGEILDAAGVRSRLK